MNPKTNKTSRLIKALLALTAIMTIGWMPFSLGYYAGGGESDGFGLFLVNALGLGATATAGYLLGLRHGKAGK